MSSIRRVREGTQTQGEDERIAYRLDVSNWGSGPADVSVVVKNRAGEDVTSEVAAGSSTVAGNVITLPVIHSLAAGMLYRVEVAFTVVGNVLEAVFYIRAEV